MNWIVEKGHQISRWLKAGPRRMPGVLAVGCGIVLIIVYFWLAYAPPDNAVTAPQATAGVQQPESATLERQLEQILSSMDGAGQVRVMITYATGTEIVPAMNVQSQSTTDEQINADGTVSRTQRQTEDSQPVSNQSEPLVLTEKTPQILGVVVVAEGADDLFVRMNLQKAVETVLQIPTRKVEVFPMQTQQGGEASNDSH